MVEIAPYCIGSNVWPGLSKLTEECGEVCQVVGKIIGNEGRLDHWDGSHLPIRLIEEMGDVIAAAHFVARHNSLDMEALQSRVNQKMIQFEDWHRAQADLGEQHHD